MMHDTEKYLEVWERINITSVKIYILKSLLVWSILEISANGISQMYLATTSSVILVHLYVDVVAENNTYNSC